MGLDRTIPCRLMAKAYHIMGVVVHCVAAGLLELSQYEEVCEHVLARSLHSTGHVHHTLHVLLDYGSCLGCMVEGDREVRGVAGVMAKVEQFCDYVHVPWVLDGVSQWCLCEALWLA